MGNTIRRQPISFKIPDSPDYKYLNLTSFAGLQQTDNPFTAQSNSASDVLNVYVDEQNALTTRPRVANKIDFSKIEGVIVASYVLNNKTYFKIKNGDVVSLYDDSGTLFDLANDVILNETEFSMLDYNGTLILFDGTQILVYENDIWVMAKNWSKLPIPLTTIRHTQNKKEGDLYENRNILTTKNRESYDLSSQNTDFISDDYHKKAGVLFKNDAVERLYSSDEPSTHGEIFLFDDGSFIKTGLNTNNFTFGKLNGKNISTEIVDFQIGSSWLATAKQKIRFVYKTTAGFTVVAKSETTQEWVQNTITLPENYYQSSTVGVYMSPSGKYIVVVKMSTDGKVQIRIYSCVESDGILTVDAATAPIEADYYASEFGIHGLFIDYFDNIYLYKQNKDDPVEWELCKLTVSAGIAKLEVLRKIIDDTVPYSTNLNSRAKIIADGSKIYSINGDKYLDLTQPDFPEVSVSLDGALKNGVAAVSTDGTILYGAIYGVDENSNNLYFRKSFTPSAVENKFIPYTKNTEVNIYSSLTTTLDNRYMCISTVNENGQYAPTIFYQMFDSKEPLYEIVYDNKEHTNEIAINKTLLFDNTFWFYSTNSNIVRWNSGDNPLYIPDTNYDEVGDEKPLTNALIISENTLGLFKKDKTYTATPTTINEQYTYLFTELTNEYGCYSQHGAVVSPLRNIPIVVGLNEISGLYSSENISKVNRYYSSLSLNVDRQYRKTDNKNNRYFVPEKIWAANIKYWSVFACSCDFGSRWLIFDDRTSDWFYWEVPAKVDNLWSDSDKLYFLSHKDKKIRVFETTDIVHPQNPELTEYYDLNRKLIKWHWRSQILPLGTINYYKKLIDTTFIVADTEANDSYGLNYTFRAYRKNISESDLNTIKNDLQYVQSVTKKTLISRFNFLQFEISHTEDDDQLNNNKLRLIGMALKYVLLGGIMQ